MSRSSASPVDVGRCKICGCSALNPCLVDGMPCSWSTPDTCTACVSFNGILTGGPRDGTKLSGLVGIHLEIPEMFGARAHLLEAESEAELEERVLSVILSGLLRESVTMGPETLRSRRELLQSVLTPWEISLEELELQKQEQIKAARAVVRYHVYELTNLFSDDFRIMQWRGYEDGNCDWHAAPGAPEAWQAKKQPTPE